MEQAISLSAVQDARRVIATSAIRTPLVRLNLQDVPAEIYLKLENLQPIGSFKIRGAANAIARLPKEKLDQGVCVPRLPATWPRVSPGMQNDSAYLAL